MSVILYPAIDLLGGQAVRLHLGDYDQKTVYEPNPFVAAQRMRESGTPWVHMVDLDGARAGRPLQSKLICELQKECGVKVQAGGGIRDQASAESLLQSGIARVVIGSLAMKDPQATLALLEEFGPERITLALDVRYVDGVPCLTSQGWEVTEKKELWEAVERYEKAGFRHVLCTDVSKDGTLKGPNVDLYREFVRRFPTIQIQASGGVSSLDDIRQLKVANVSGIVVGKALYEGIFTLEEALAC